MDFMAHVFSRTGGYKTCAYSDAVSKGREEIDETTVQHIKEQ